MTCDSRIVVFSLFKLLFYSLEALFEFFAVLLNAVVDGNTHGLCWGGSFRLEDECCGFYSLLGALAGCNAGKVGFHQDGVLYGDVFFLCFNEAFEDSSV